MAIQINIIKSCRDVITVCDTELIGKTFQEKERILEVKENFYKGNEKTFQETIKLLQYYSKEDATFNIVGKNSIQAALQAGIITKDGIKKIQEIPYSLVLL